jgi:hypothetical protein
LGTLVDFTFLKQRYDFELERRDRLTAGVSLPAGFLTALGSVMALMARGFSYENHALTNVFVLALASGAFALVVSVSLLAWAYGSWRYEQLPRLRFLQTREDDFRRFYRSLGRTAADATEAFDLEIRSQVIEAADWNAKLNNYRARLMHYANTALLAVLLFAAIAGVAYIVDQSTRILMPKSASVSEPGHSPWSEEAKEWRRRELTKWERFCDWINTHVFGLEPFYVPPLPRDPRLEGLPPGPKNVRWNLMWGPLPPYEPPPERPDFDEIGPVPKNIRL